MGVAQGMGDMILDLWFEGILCAIHGWHFRDSFGIVWKVAVFHGSVFSVFSKEWKIRSDTRSNLSVKAQPWYQEEEKGKQQK